MPQTAKPARTKAQRRNLRTLTVDTNDDVFAQCYEAETKNLYRMARDFVMDDPLEKFSTARYLLLLLILDGRLVYDTTTKRSYHAAHAPENVRRMLQRSHG
jgi:hypothetical protein